MRNDFDKNDLVFSDAEKEAYLEGAAKLFKEITIGLHGSYSKWASKIKNERPWFFEHRIVIKGPISGLEAVVYDFKISNMLHLPNELKAAYLAGRARWGTQIMVFEVYIKDELQFKIIYKPNFFKNRDAEVNMKALVRGIRQEVVGTTIYPPENSIVPPEADESGEPKSEGRNSSIPARIREFAGQAMEVMRGTLYANKSPKKESTPVLDHYERARVKIEAENVVQFHFDEVFGSKNTSDAMTFTMIFRRLGILELEQFFSALQSKNPSENEWQNLFLKLNSRLASWEQISDLQRDQVRAWMIRRKLLPINFRIE